MLGAKQPAIETDLLGLLPQSSQSWVEADRILTRRASRAFAVLAGSGDFARAKEAAAVFYTRLGESPELFDTLDFKVDMSAAGEIAAFLHEYRYMLLDGESAALLKAGGEKEFAAEALAWAYGAMTLTDLDKLESDPFLFTERELRYYLEAAKMAGNLNPRDGALSAEFEGKHWVLVRGTLSEAGASLDGSGVRKMYRAAELPPDGAEETAVRFVFSGFPFHSYESAAKARREITVISAVTALLLLLLFLHYFRSPFPVLAILGAAAGSVGSGLAAAFLVFRSVHILTLVFGSTLIGISVDYAIHYCVRRFKLPGEGRRALVKSVTLSFASSLICFLAFLFAPYAALRQFAVFAAAGLASSCATVMCLSFGFWDDGAKRAARQPRRIFFFCDIRGPFRALKKAAAPVLAAILLAALAILILNPPSIKNNIRSLYSVPAKLREWERIASGVLGYVSSGAYGVVSGNSPEEALQREEVFRALLEERTETRFLGASRFLPSARTQEEHYRAAERLLPLGEAQFRALGFQDAPDRDAAWRSDFAAKAGQYVRLADLPAGLGGALSSLLFEGAADTGWYAVILSEDGGFNAAAARDLAAEYDWADAVNKTEDISAELDALTRYMLALLAAAFALILAGLFVLYRGRAALKTAAVPAAGILTALALHALLGASLSFFTAAGLALVLGLGLDYIFYLRESVEEKTRGADAAVVLSFVTTALSFGALLVSSFPPVRLLALTVFPGLTAAFIFAFFLREKPKSAA
jgi:predicted exporter